MIREEDRGCNNSTLIRGLDWRNAVRVCALGPGPFRCLGAQRSLAEARGPHDFLGLSFSSVQADDRTPGMARKEWFQQWKMLGSSCLWDG